MNRLIAKLLSIVNVLLFILLAVVTPLSWLLFNSGGMHMQPMGQPLHMVVGVFAGSILLGVVVCGFIALMASINDSLTDLNAKMDELLALKKTGKSPEA